jgi:hypothetical protein
VVPAKVAGFQYVSEDGIAGLLESHSLPLTDELAELSKNTCKGVHDEYDDDDDEIDSISSEVNALTIKVEEIDEAMHYFQNHDHLYDCAPTVGCELQHML